MITIRINCWTRHHHRIRTFRSYTPVYKRWNRPNWWQIAYRMHCVDVRERHPSQCSYYFYLCCCETKMSTSRVFWQEFTAKVKSEFSCCCYRIDGVYFLFSRLQIHWVDGILVLFYWWNKTFRSTLSIVWLNLVCPSPERRYNQIVHTDSFNITANNATDDVTLLKICTCTDELLRILRYNFINNFPDQKALAKHLWRRWTSYRKMYCIFLWNDR